MGQIAATRNLVATKVVRLAGQLVQPNICPSAPSDFTPGKGMYIL